MTRSANEVTTLAAKAARGTGAPPGQATLFGRAALRHLLSGRDVDDLVKALEALPQGPIMTLPLAFARLAENAVAGHAVGKLPLNDLAISYVEVQPYSYVIEQKPDVISVTLDLSQPAERLPMRRLTLPESFAQQMDHLAAKLLVPESDTSRLSGAGAGLTDND